MVIDFSAWKKSTPVFSSVPRLSSEESLVSNAVCSSAVAERTSFPNSALLRPSIHASPFRNAVLSVGGASCRTESMKRLTCASLAPGVSVRGMISSQSVVTVSFW